MACTKICWIILGFVLSCLCANQGEAISNLTVNQASELDKVTQLPGQPKVGFNHYAGHVTVDEKGGRVLFYWFYEASSQKENKPLVLWLNGGPGCSSVGYGATQEIGPFLVDPSGTTLSFNEYAWNNEANLLILESPIGVGFSYTNTSSVYDILGDNLTGHYVPQLAEVIYDFNNKSLPQTNRINLKGFMVGNPETHTDYDWKGNMDYAWSHGIISEETYKVILSNCDFFANNTWDNKICDAAVKETLAQSDQIDKYSLYKPKCLVNATTSTTNPLKRRLSTASRSSYDPCLDNYAIKYYNRPDVQNALHATQGGKLVQWAPCNYTLFDNWKDSPDSVLPIYQKLIAGGLRIWVAGWTQDYEGLKFSTFYGAGHAVPIFDRNRALVFFRAFLSGAPLPDKR
eukprot:PITA_31234